MLSIILTKLQSGALTALAVLLILFGAYTAGGRAARRSAAYDKASEEAKTFRRVRDVENQTAVMGDGAITSELAANWVRGGKTKAK